MSLSIDERIANNIQKRVEKTKRNVAKNKAAGIVNTKARDESQRIKGLGSMDAANQSISEYDIGDDYAIQDIKYLEKQGYSASQIADDYAKRGGKMGSNVANYFLQSGQLGEDGNKTLRQMAKERAGIYQDKSTNNSNNTNNNINNNIDNSSSKNTELKDSFNTDNRIDNSGNTDLADSFNTDNRVSDSYNTNIADSFNTDKSFNAGDIDQNVGKRGDMNTDINNSNIGAGSSVGNDFSVTIGNVTAGRGANANSETTSGLSNMQSLAAYQALNNNQFARSQSMLNGLGRSSQAIEQGQRATGAQDKVANLYNLVGRKQQYWQDRSIAQDGFYLGDIYGNRPTPVFKRPGDPEQPEDRTQEIADSFSFNPK